MSVAPTPFTRERLGQDLDVLWILLTGYLVFLMQCGFALFEAGTVRLKNVKNILLKNIMDAVVGAIVWWAWGFAFAYGSCGDGTFIGHSNFFLANSEAISDTDESRQLYANFFFGWAFSATAATIVGGALAERCKFKAYIIYTVVMNTLGYPFIVYWIWSKGGWLSAKRINCETGEQTPWLSSGNGVMDFSGSGVVHMVGGCASLMGIIFLGARIGKFSADGRANNFAPSNPSQMTLGVLILWFTWYGFNTGSTACFFGCMWTSSHIAVNTTLGAAAGGATTLIVTLLVGAPYDISPLLNGILVGLVSVTGPSAFVQPYAAAVIGIVGGLLYLAASRLLLRLRLDDVVDAVPVHLVGGMWGLLATGFFATEDFTRLSLGFANDWGVFYGGNGTQLGIQILGIVMILLWECTIFGITFGILKWGDWLRVAREEEEQGLDMAQGMGLGLSVLNPKNW